MKTGIRNKRKNVSRFANLKNVLKTKLITPGKLCKPQSNTDAVVPFMVFGYLPKQRSAHRRSNAATPENSPSQRFVCFAYRLRRVLFRFSQNATLTAGLVVVKRFCVFHRFFVPYIILLHDNHFTQKGQIIRL